MRINRWGKLNLGLIAVIGLLMMVIFWKVRWQKEEYLQVTVQLTGANGWQQQTIQPPSWLVETIKKGDSEVNVNGKKMVEVEEIESYEEGVNKVTFLKLKLLVSKNDKNETYRYKQKALEVGSTLEVLLKNTRVYGSVVSIGDNSDEEKKYLKVKVIVYGKPEWFADNIKVGDKVYTGFDNSQLQSEILGKTVRKSAGVTTLYKMSDVELDLNLQVSQRQGVNYFASYQPIKIGNQLYIPMENYNLYGAYVVSFGNED